MWIKHRKTGAWHYIKDANPDPIGVHDIACGGDGIEGLPLIPVDSVPASIGVHEELYCKDCKEIFDLEEKEAEQKAQAEKEASEKEAVEKDRAEKKERLAAEKAESKRIKAELAAKEKEDERQARFAKFAEDKKERESKEWEEKVTTEHEAKKHPNGHR